jgi:hypothetical protein
MFQSGKVRDAVWGSDWVGTPISHQRSLNIIMTVSEEFIFTAGKIIPVSRRTFMLVSIHAPGIPFWAIIQCIVVGAYRRFDMYLFYPGLIKAKRLKGRDGKWE